jgi:hypothetical protein
MTTANRRGRAVIAIFIPQRLAVCIVQALSLNHFREHLPFLKCETWQPNERDP